MTFQNISIIVCTYNRCSLLADCIQSIVDQNYPGEYQLIIVDNASSDGTSSLLKELDKQYPPIKVLYEPRQGLSHARNTGLEHVTGDLVFFTDDDVRVPSNWLSSYSALFRKYDCDAIGGPVLPDPDSSPLPSWLDSRLYHCLALRQEENKTRFLTTDDWMPYGANMAFKKNSIKGSGGFDASLGRVGGFLGAGEESKIFKKILNTGGKVLFSNDAPVLHYITKERTKKRYFRRWYADTSTQNFLSSPKSEIQSSAFPKWLITATVSSFLKSIYMYLKGSGDSAFLLELRAWEYIGTMRGYYLIKRKNTLSSGDRTW